MGNDQMTPKGGSMDKVTETVGKRKPPAKGGSRKGIPNKNTAELKEMILQALTNAGGVEYLTKQADEKPVAFLALVGKVLPLQVAGAGPNGEHVFKKIVVEVVKAS